MDEIIPCIIFEEQVIEDCNKIISLYHFEDIILCLYNPVYDKYTHITGKTIGKITSKREFENNKCIYLYLFNLYEYFKKNSCYDLEKILRSVKIKFTQNPYLYINEFGSIKEIKDKDLLKKAKDIFDREINFDYFILDDYITLNNANDILKNNINIINENVKSKEKYKFIDAELDRYNNFIKMRKN